MYFTVDHVLYTINNDLLGVTIGLNTDINCPSIFVVPSSVTYRNGPDN